MRVDLVAPHYRPVVGGIENHVAGLAAAAMKKGHEVMVHALDLDLQGHRLPTTETLEGVPVRRYPARLRFGYYTTSFHPRLAGDLAHLHGYGFWTNDWIVRHAPSTPRILSLHHGLQIPPRTLIHSAYHRLHRWTRGRGTLKRVDAVIANTELDRDRLRQAGFPMDKVHVIPTGVPDEAFERAKPEAPPPGWDAYFLYLGRLHREKCIDVAIEALARVPGKVGLVIAGPDQGEAAALKERVRHLGLGDRVRFLGAVDGHRKRSLIRGARALVLPSRYEGLGVVILEAWAQGVPALASKVGGVPYLVKDGVDGLLHPWKDHGALAGQMAELLGEKASTAGMGRKGHDKARGYRESVQLGRILDLYRDGLASPAPPTVAAVRRGES